MTGRSNPMAELTQRILANRTAVKPTRIIKVGMVELSFSNQRSCYLPLSAGMLQAYAEKNLTFANDYQFVLPIYQPMRIEEASEMLSECDVIGVSNRVWNEQNSLAIAQDYKRRNPNGIVVFGGPQVPDSKKQFRRNRTVELDPDELKRKRIHFTEDFHRAHPFIDMACHGEGERIFKIILEQMAVDGCRDKRSIPQVSFLDGAGDFHFNMKLERMTDEELAQCGSPFTSGIFDRLMTAYPNQRWTGMYETDRGCPYSCTYCDWGGATEDGVSKFPLEQVHADIKWIAEREIGYLFLCNANFGILERDIQVAEIFAEVRAKYGYPESMNTQNAKNPKSHTIQALKILEKAGINKATVMSQQSTNPDTLDAVRRKNMKLDEYNKIQKELAAADVHTMTDMIIPMPEETYDSVLGGIATLIANGQHNRIQFNNLSILRNTEMGNPEYQEHYGFEIVRSKIVNYHGKKQTAVSGIEEYQDLVVATNTMPREDWVKTRALCYMVSLVYFNKLLQIPIVTLREASGVSYRTVFETIMEQSRHNERYPIFSQILNLFERHAYAMQNGGEELMHAPKYLDIWWYPDECALMDLCTEDKLDVFYVEAETMFALCLENPADSGILHEAITLNRSLLKQPFQTSDLELTLSYNVWDLYRAALRGSAVPVVHGNHMHTIDRTTKDSRGTNWWGSWEDWYIQMVWFCNRNGAYLYGNINPHQEIAGQH